jgi:hypothetical protein
MRPQRAALTRNGARPHESGKKRSALTPLAQKKSHIKGALR